MTEKQQSDYEFITGIGKSMSGESYYGKTQNTFTQKSDILLDPDALSAMFVILNTMIASGYDIKFNKSIFNLSSNRQKNSLYNLLKLSNFNLLHTQIIINLVINNIAVFQKIENGKGKAEAFRMINSDTLSPVDESLNELGNYSKYDITDPVDNTTVRVTDKEIFIIRLTKYDNDFWGINRFEALSKVLNNKQVVEYVRSNLLATNQYRTVWNMDDDYKTFIGFCRCF
jgi:hypothetical protein